MPSSFVEQKAAAASIVDLLRASVNESGQAQQPFEEFCETRLHIKTKDGRVVPFKLNEPQRKYLAIKRAVRRDPKKPNRFLLLKARQMGLTTMEQAESYHQAVTRRNQKIATVAQEGDAGAEIFAMVNLFHDRDDVELRPRTPPHGNTRKLKFPSINSEFGVLTAAGKAPGRGQTFQRLHCTEVSSWSSGHNKINKQQEAFAGLLEAAGGGEVVLETTARGHELFRVWYGQAKRGENDWTPVFLPWFVDPQYSDRLHPDEAAELVAAMDDEEQRLVKLHGLTPEQIAWRRRKKRELGRLFKQEYPEDDETCFLVSGTSYFEVERIVDLLESTPDYTDRDRREKLIAEQERPDAPYPFVSYTEKRGGHVVVWEEPQRGDSYVMGVDTSEGLAGCDPNGFGILKRSTGEQVAAMHGLFKPAELAEHSVSFASRYNNALIGVERQNHGHAVLQRIQALGYRAPNRQLFHFNGNQAGWSTDQKTRPIMLDMLANAVEDGSMVVRDRLMLSECITFRMQSDGLFEHDSGCHDDSIFKWAIAWQMRRVRQRRAKFSMVDKVGG